MNKDTQTLIEREAEKRAAENFAFPSSHSSAIDRETFARGAHFAISLFKWRKVSDELPEERTDINIKSNGCIYSSRMVRIDDAPIFFINGVSLTFKLEDVTEWMPMPQID